jgi:hypothetical protein
VSRRKKVLLGLGITPVVVWFLWLPLALGLMAGFPFALWDDPVEAGVESVGACHVRGVSRLPSLLA